MPSVSDLTPEETQHLLKLFPTPDTILPERQNLHDTNYTKKSCKQMLSPTVWPGMLKLGMVCPEAAGKDFP